MVGGSRGPGPWLTSQTHDSTEVYDYGELATDTQEEYYRR